MCVAGKIPTAISRRRSNGQRPCRNELASTEINAKIETLEPMGAEQGHLARLGEDDDAWGGTAAGEYHCEADGPLEDAAISRLESLKPRRRGFFFFILVFCFPVSWIKSRRLGSFWFSGAVHNPTWMLERKISFLSYVFL